MQIKGQGHNQTVGNGTQRQEAHCLLPPPSFKFDLPVENFPEVNAVKGPVSQSNYGKWNTTIRSSLSAAFQAWISTFTSTFSEVNAVIGPVLQPAWWIWIPKDKKLNWLRDICLIAALFMSVHIYSISQFVCYSSREPWYMFLKVHWWRQNGPWIFLNIYPFFVESISIILQHTIKWTTSFKSTRYYTLGYNNFNNLVLPGCWFHSYSNTHS